MLSDVPFQHIVIDSDSPADPHNKAVGDINGDGFVDALVASSSGEGMYWYEYPAWTKHAIRTTGSWTTDLTTADIDNDGDIDVVAPGVQWYENPGPAGDPRTDLWVDHFIGSSPSHDIEVSDIDEDGKLDVVVRSQHTAEIYIFFQETPTSWIRVAPNTGNGEGTDIGDIDGDGDPDLAHNGFWLENPADGGGPAARGVPWPKHTIDSGWNDVGVQIVDLNGDSKQDIVLAPSESSNSFSWYEAADPKNGPWTEHVIVPSVEFFHQFRYGDVDRDGDLDLVTAEMHQSSGDDQVSVYFNEGNALAWRQQVVDTTGSHNIELVDFGNDGDLDIFGANWSDGAPNSAVVEYWRNDLDPLFLDDWARHEVDSDLPYRTIFVDSADIDEDGLKDLITGGWWYRNPGVVDGVWTRNQFGWPLNNMAAVFDFDENGSLDVLGTEGTGSDSNSNFVWARNDGGASLPVLSNIEAGVGDFLQGVAVDRFGPDGTGPIEIALSWHSGGGGVQMLTVGNDPATDLWSWRSISTTTQSEQLSSGDIDADGDNDLLLGTKWLRNDQTAWTPFTLHSTSQSPDRNRLADINGDGRLDSVIGYEAISASGKLAWYEQPLSDATGIWNEHVIATLIGPMSVDVRDMDGDGDLDVVAGEHNLSNPSAAGLFVFENADGNGTDWVQHEVYIGDEHHDGAHIVDIDNDGDFDIVSIGWINDKLVVYENLSRSPLASIVDAPTITPDGGVFFSLVEVSLSVSTVGAQIFYTLDGSVPTESSTAYMSPFTISSSTTVRARAFKSGFTPSPVSSKNLVVLDGSAERVSDDLILLYQFDETSGNTVFDTSGFGTPLNLTINNSNNVTWTGEALSVESATVIQSFGGVTKVHDAVTASNAITIEVWIDPASATQNGPARIFTMSADSHNRDFTMGQGVFGSSGDRIEMRLRTTTTGNNGTVPALSSAGGTLNDELQHVVYTRDSSGNAIIYVNGSEVVSGAISGNLSNWNEAYEIALANELTQDRPWLGAFHLVAMYENALTLTDVVQNYFAGPNPVGPPADFDGDLDVDGKDFLAWQRGFGTLTPNATKSDGDADLDQDVDGDDLTVWESQFGNLAGDFDNDNDVDGFDFLTWQRGLGIPAPNATKADGDADHDQDVDGDDLGVWESQFGAIPAPAIAVTLTEGEPILAENTNANNTNVVVGSPIEVNSVGVVPPPPLDQNTTPLVYAGEDLTAVLSESATVKGDVVVNLPSNLTVSWSMVSGPGTVVFSNPSELSTTVSFSTAGIYELELTATNAGASASDRVIVTVVGSPLANTLEMFFSSVPLAIELGNHKILESGFFSLIVEPFFTDLADAVIAKDFAPRLQLNSVFESRIPHKDSYFEWLTHSKIWAQDLIWQDPSEIGNTSTHSQTNEFDDDRFSRFLADDAVNEELLDRLFADDEFDLLL